jgi:UDP-N-acetylmuramyl pentapeptide phosphotransferase/UDP-N-acetylglucosamine-1-phosphate transferase
MSWAVSIVLGITVGIASAVGSALALRFLRWRQIVDRPNERSSHSLPTPRGLGLAVVPLVLASWLGIAAIGTSTPREVLWVCAGALALAVLSWVDDVRRLSVAPRLLTQIIVVVVGVLLFEGPLLVPIAWVPAALQKAAMVVLWLGLINQVNFTDGIDGHLGTSLASVFGGLFVVTLLAKTSSVMGAFSLAIAGAAAGFLLYNWAPAKGFMGDVGSVPLGYLTGWLLLREASYGLWAPVVILPLFYFADTAVTYGRLIAGGTKFWRPHRTYLYQRAARTMGHARVVSTVALCNAVLLGCAVLAVSGATWPAMLGALATVAITYGYLAHGVADKLPVAEG